jgi:hypothetical protein
MQSEESDLEDDVTVRGGKDQVFFLSYLFLLLLSLKPFVCRSRTSSIEGGVGSVTIQLLSYANRTYIPAPMWAIRDHLELLV